MIVVNMMLSKRTGGIENSFLNYCRCLLMKGHEVHAIIAPSAAVQSNVDEMTGIHLYQLKNYNEWDVFATWKLSRILKSIQPDVVLVHANRAMALSKPLQKKLKIISVVHNYSIKRALKFKYVITTTQDLRKNIQLASNVNPAIFVLPNTVQAPKQVYHKEIIEPAVIGTFGRFVKKKGFDVFIHALALLKNEGIRFNAILAGIGEEEKNLRSLCLSLGLDKQLSFRGWMQPQDFFSEIDIFCLPSLHEPFGMVLIEAFSYEKPVVSTLTEGPNEIAQHQFNALMVKKTDAHDLAKKLRQLISNPALGRQLAINGKQTYLKYYELEVVAEKLDRILKTVKK